MAEFLVEQIRQPRPVALELLAYLVPVFRAAQNLGMSCRSVDGPAAPLPPQRDTSTRGFVTIFVTFGGRFRATLCVYSRGQRGAADQEWLIAALLRLVDVTMRPEFVVLWLTQQTTSRQGG